MRGQALGNYDCLAKNLCTLLRGITTVSAVISFRQQVLFIFAIYSYFFPISVQSCRVYKILTENLINYQGRSAGRSRDLTVIRNWGRNLIGQGFVPN